MGRSRRKYKQSRAKVRCALPKKKPGVFKPAFAIPRELLAGAGNGDEEAGKRKWDEKASVVLCPSLQVPSSGAGDGRGPISEFDPIDSGSDLEADDLKSALGKKRRDGKSAPVQPLTTIQRVHIARLIAKHGDDYQAMSLDIELNAMQHTVAELKKLCRRFNVRSGRLARAIEERNPSAALLERE
ncbi:unnamed protein product [Spirodela intermedia]|uniref:Nucleolar protein 16 n=1 Tax=Spirodela intermedia TaxID=51605 RepID=A0A7I8I9U0_SPIIN|nr:unnamed protein product [Spirodela intermedia]CAA6654288.1 unnamed protein product [Spirodela intermedia]